MIEGVVNTSREAVIRLAVQGPSGQGRDIEAVIDTGYSGMLTLPSSIVAELGLSFRSSGRAILANGDEDAFSTYDATVLWDGAPGGGGRRAGTDAARRHGPTRGA